MLEKKLKQAFDLSYVETYEHANTLSRIVGNRSNEALLKNELYHTIYFSQIRNNCYEIDKISLMQISNTLHVNVILKVYDKEGEPFLLNSSNWMSRYKLGLTDLKDLKEAEIICERIVEKVGVFVKNLIRGIDKRLDKLDSSIIA